MLRLTALKLTNFGPFKGEQAVVFPKEDGVSVFYGENMRGKTTLLNAIRFAFFGKIVGRGRRKGSLHTTGNWESAEAGHYGFEVTLEITYEGHSYRLTRTCRPRPGVTPMNDEDYSPDYFLERDGHIMGPQAAEDELRRILPEQISRFFLFDGELLQEYEDLLHADSDMGPKISGAIERILGIPVLTGARDSLKAACDRAEQRQAQAAQGDQKTRAFGNELADLHVQREVFVADLTRQEKQLEGLRAQKAATEEEMRKRERTASLLDKRDRLEADVKLLRGRAETQKAGVSAAMGSAWSALLLQPMADAAKQLKGQEAELQTAVMRTHVLKSLANADYAECPTCLQPISPAAKARVREDLHRRGGAAGAEEERELSKVRRRLDALGQQIATANPATLRLHWETFDQTERDIYERTSEIDELTRQLTEGKDDDVRRVRSAYETAIREIKALEDGVEATKAKLADNAVFRDNIQKKLDRLAGGSLVAEGRRVKLAADLHALFDEGVTVFREQLRRRVEADATRHFTSLTTESEYKALRINDNYGLTIIHENGSEIPVRSAGAEHVVALSLVGALQNNAPLRGPIIIDSPFGRLDGGHRARIVEALPEMASQVVLLVYEEELPPDRARAALKGRLRAEWILARKSARHTELAPRTGETV
jgi:DNA sulfur modification protein DndD